MSRGNTGAIGLDQRQFELRRERSDGGERIRIQGEMDLSVIGELDREMARAEASDAERIVLDLDRVEFMDAAAVRMLLTAARRSRTNGGRIRFTSAWRPQVRRLFELTGVGEVLPLAD
jgi:anti-anti-sigma factor